MPTFNYSNADYTDGELVTAAIFNTRFTDLKTFLNTTKLDGANLQNNIITGAMLADTLRETLGVNGSNIHRGKSILPTEGTRTNTAYGALSNGPDQVSSVVLPTDGLLLIKYFAAWKESVADAARAAVFVGANQLKIVEGADPPTNVVQEAHCVGRGIGGADTTATYRPLSSFPGGLQSSIAQSDYAGAATTGQILGHRSSASTDGTYLGVGGPIIVFAAAGTYDVSVRFRATSGTVSAKERKLWVEAVAF